MTAADAEPQKQRSAVSTWWRLRRFWLPHWRAIALGLLVIAGIAVVELLKPWPLKFIFDDVLGQGPLEGDTLTVLIGVVALVVAIAVFDGLLSYLLVFFLSRAGRRIVFDVRVALFDHVHRLSLQYHSRRATGDLLLRITTDVKALRDVVTESVAEMIVSVLFFVGMGVVLFVLDWQLALVAVAGTPFMALAMYHYVFKIKEYARAEREREGALASLASESLGAIRLTRLFNQEGEAARRFQAESAASLESGFAASLREERAAWAIGVFSALGTGAVLLFGVHRVVSGAITVGTLIVFASYVSSFHRPIRNIAKHASKVSRATPRIERVTELLDIEELVSDRPGARRAPALRGQIEFRGVSFAYEAGEPVLRDVDLVLPAGKVTAITGRTGAGKTTLVSLIPRLYDPTAGAVLIDGYDVREFTLASLRSQISVVLQESVLFRASVAENIAYGRPSASQAEIEEAAKASNAHEFIVALPDGYRTEIGERGETLSGGQRQRIAIARAILRDAPIVLLDEPLTGLDEASQGAVLDALDRLTRGRTVVVISHQPSVARRADVVLELDEGRVVGQRRAVFEGDLRLEPPPRLTDHAAHGFWT